MISQISWLFISRNSSVVFKFADIIMVVVIIMTLGVGFHKRHNCKLGQTIGLNGNIKPFELFNSSNGPMFKFRQRSNYGNDNDDIVLKTLQFQIMATHSLSS